jgi:hypothetical protein
MSLSNGEPAFKVHMSKHVATRLKLLIEHSPRRAEVIASLKRINDRLERDPWNFGEQRYHLSDSRIQVRVGAVSPVAVHYGVAMDRPDVYVAAFFVLEGA